MFILKKTHEKIVGQLRSDFEALTSVHKSAIKDRNDAEDNAIILNDDVEQLQTENSRLVAENETFEAANDALNRENADLVYQLELYKSVLKTLRVPVKLPARKQ